MVFPIQTVSTSIPLTDAQRDNFAARVRRDKSIREKQQTWEIMSALPHDRAVALTADLWAHREPARRRREWWFRCYGIILAYLMVGLLLCLTFLAITQFSRKMPSWFIVFQAVIQANCFLGNYLFRNRIVTPEQSGCIPLLSALKDARLTSAMVDALGGRWFDAPSDYQSALRQTLAVVLPEYTRSDAPPLDTYQQNILRREIKRYTRRLRKPVASVPHLEAEFVVAAVRYLSGLQAANTAPAKNVALVETIAALPPAELETPTRCAVREAAMACLPLVHTTRQ